jgi:hypothetical protein
MSSVPHASSPGSRLVQAILLVLVLAPSLVTATALLSELRVPIPSLNDTAVHYVLIQRAGEALASGENPFDHWLPELELGFPFLFYYQHLPHLTVVLLHRLLLKQVDLLTLFNLIRYLLLVGFPLTVLWSMRRMGFSAVAAAVAAAAATLLSSGHRYGFEYDSYIWRGLGMYTQLWAMHLSFVTLACVHRLLQRGEGYVAAAVAAAALVLSHLVYAYMMALTALALALIGMDRSNVRRRVGRLAVTGGLAAVITSYFWLPFVIEVPYLSASTYLERWKYDSFGARQILTWLVNGDLLDHGRLPVLTVLLALGIAGALVSRTPPARLALVLLALWLPLYFGRATWGRLAGLLPMHEGLLFHRFIGGVHLAAILLVGLGGEWIWRQMAPLREHWRAAVLAVAVLAVLAPALRERWGFYARNAEWMARTSTALDADQEAREILSALRRLPRGRVHAGLRANWGKALKVGDLHFYDLLTFNRIAAVSPPYSSLSLNADLIWHFDDRNPAHYELFNVTHLVAPRVFEHPPFLRPVLQADRYVLYEADAWGYARFAGVTGRQPVGSQSNLFAKNRSWFLSAEPAAGRYIRHDYPRRDDRTASLMDAAGSPDASAGCQGRAWIAEERVLPGRIDLRVDCPEAATLVLKTTFHPNWRVSIDGRRARPFMVSPSYLGVSVPAGPHQVRAEYRSPAYKTLLLLVGTGVLAAAIRLRRRFSRLDASPASRG